MHAKNYLLFSILLLVIILVLVFRVYTPTNPPLGKNPLPAKVVSFTQEGNTKKYTTQEFTFVTSDRWQQDTNDSQRLYLNLSPKASASTANVLDVASIQTGIVAKDVDEITILDKKSASTKKQLTIDGILSTQYIYTNGADGNIYNQAVVIPKNDQVFVIFFKTAADDSDMHLIPEFEQLLQTVKLL